MGPYTKTIASEKKWPLFKFGKEKVLQPKFKKKNQNLVLRVWFALLKYKKTQQSRIWISVGHFFYQFSCLSKPKNFLSKCQNIKKEKKTAMRIYQKRRKNKSKNFYCSCCCNLTKKKLSLKLYMCKTIFEREFTKNRRKSIPTRCAPPNY